MNCGTIRKNCPRINESNKISISNQIIPHFSFNSMTDNELMQWQRIAVEMRCNRYVKAIKQEINRRWRYE